MYYNVFYSTTFKFLAGKTFSRNSLVVEIIYLLCPMITAQLNAYYDTIYVINISKMLIIIFI